MTSDGNFPTDTASQKELSKVIALDHYRAHQEIKHPLHPATEETNIEDKLPAGEKELKDFGLSPASADSPPPTATDPAYQHWTTHYPHDLKLRELYIRPKLSPIFFDDELDALNSSLEVTLNKCDYLIRKIRYYSGGRGR